LGWFSPLPFYLKLVVSAIAYPFAIVYSYLAENIGVANSIILLTSQRDKQRKLFNINNYGNRFTFLKRVSLNDKVFTWVVGLWQQPKALG
jgi:hypothetical protein